MGLKGRNAVTLSEVLIHSVIKSDQNGIERTCGYRDMVMAAKIKSDQNGIERFAICLTKDYKLPR